MASSITSPSFESFGRASRRPSPLLTLSTSAAGRKEPTQRLEVCPNVVHRQPETNNISLGLTKWHLGNQNCKQVLLGISHDSGYAPFLDEILQDQATRDRVAVLEGTAIEYQLVETHVHVMKGTELDKGLFRGDKLSTERPIDRISSFTSSYNRAPPSPESTSSNVATPAPSTLVPWSAAVKTISPPPQMTTPLGGKYGVKPAQAPPPELNGWNPGERGLDKPINFSRTVYQSMKGRGPKERLCNNHYLRGPCMKLDQCQFIHDEAPTKDELAVIAYMSRMNPCTAGQYCDEDSCIYGHHVSDGRKRRKMTR